MSLKKLKGLVIHRFNDLGIDSIITVLSEDSPVCRFKIKGLQKSKKQNQMVAEIGSLITLEYYYKQNRDLYYTKEIHLIERFESLKSSYHGFVILSYICELLTKLLNEGEIHTKEYHLLYGALNEFNKNGFHSFFIPFFLIRLLKNLGFLSIESKCSLCMKSLSFNNNKIGMNINSFEFYCSNCSNIFIDRRDVLDFLIDCKKLNFELIKQKKIEKKTTFIINQMLFNYISSLGVVSNAINTLKSIL